MAKGLHRSWRRLVLGAHNAFALHNALPFIMLRPLPLAITIIARNPSEPWLVLSCEHMAGTRHYSAPEQVEHLELDLAEFQERPPSQPLECVGGGGGAVEPEVQEQPSIGVVERARWIGSALPSRRRGARRAGVRGGKKTLQRTAGY